MNTFLLLCLPFAAFDSGKGNPRFLNLLPSPHPKVERAFTSYLGFTKTRCVISKDSMLKK